MLHINDVTPSWLPQAESKPICPLRLVVARPSYKKSTAQSRADQNKRILDQMRFEDRIK